MKKILTGSEIQDSTRNLKIVPESVSYTDLEMREIPSGEIVFDGAAEDLSTDQLRWIYDSEDDFESIRQTGNNSN